ncbi:MAG: aminofutalosine synthase MqnE [Bacteroidota bacterium]
MIDFISNNNDIQLENINDKIHRGKRISADDAIYLYKNAPMGIVAYLADSIKRKLHGEKVFYNKNFHVEPTNICVFNCDFCSFSTTDTTKGWKKSHDDIMEIVRQKGNSGANEIHITGGAIPEYNIDFYIKLFNDIKKEFPNIHIKAFTAVEINYFAHLATLDVEEVLIRLKKAGLDSMPGGGAEIFDEIIRKKICKKKLSGEQWLKTHEIAHNNNISSNATMLYGHVENIEHRIDHLSKLRDLQDKTKGFNAFIPLKFRNKNNRLSDVQETSIIDDLKTFAVARIFLDNIPHLKAYWPMIGKDIAKLLLNFGVDDLDGTIQNTTKIYSMAGSKESEPEMTEDKLRDLIFSAGFKAVERDSLYNSLHI